jgi:hypothetical protein
VQGVWTTEHPGYESRFLGLSRTEIRFGDGPESVAIHTIESVEMSDEHDRVRFRIAYDRNGSDSAGSLTFHFLRKDSTLRLADDDRVTWKRTRRTPLPPRRSSDNSTLAPVSGSSAPAGGTARRLRSDLVVANERAAIKFLSSLPVAQQRFRVKARADEDRDGVGGFGSFAELSGQVGVRGGRPALPVLILPTAVRDGKITRRGYNFRIHLPAPGRKTAAEQGDGGFGDEEIDIDEAERFWCCYAWPTRHGRTGERAFFINQKGIVLANAEGWYTGDREPAAFAAFDDSAGGLEGKIADGEGADQQVWKRAK